MKPWVKSDYSLVVHVVMKVSNRVNVLMHVSPFMLSDVSETSAEQLHFDHVAGGVVDDSSSLFVHLIYNPVDARSESLGLLN